VELAKQLGVVYFRPNAVFADAWRGSDKECETAKNAGLQLILTVRNNGGNRKPTTPPKDLNQYKKTISEIIDKYRPAVLVIENEENSSLFYTGTMDEYATQLKVACEVAHAKGIKCTNGGLVSTLVALLVYDNYLRQGNKTRAESFAARVFSPQERRQLGSPRYHEQVNKGRALLEVYKLSDIDYVNFHWYETDPITLEEAATYLRTATGLPLITNEIGQHDTNVETTKALMEKVIELGFPYAVWFSVDAPRAKALTNSNGTLRETGRAFQDFIKRTF
jgi:hypothetical protein